MKLSASCLTLFAALTLTIHPALPQEDVEGGKDVPYFTRMPTFYIYATDNKDFDAYQFFDGKQLITVEGKIHQTTYYQKEDATPASELQIRRNFITAIKNMGGTVLVEGKSSLFEDWRAQATLVVGKIVKGGKQIWVEVWPSDNSFTLTVAEKEQMRQEISASDMLDALNKDGFVALDIHFDTGKSTIRDESRPIIDQIVTLLQGNGDLNLSIEGHTDNVGDAKSNKALSDQRAKSVLDALTKAGVDGKRLSAIGYGQDRPVADNRNDEGRAKNRRVELVKK